MSLFDSLALRREADPVAARTSAAITLLIAGLAALGVVLVFSSTAASSGLDAHDATRFLRRQLLWVALGTGVFVLARTTDLEGLRRHSGWILLLALALLVAVLVPGVGRRINGARRWVRIGPLNGQPSEVAKIALTVFVAAWAARQGDAIRTLRGLLPGVAVIGLVIGLVVIEPDMGTAALLSAVSGALLIAAGARLRHLLALATPGVLLAAVFAFTRLDYVKRRIASFLDPTLDPMGAGFQPRQSLIAIGSGGPLGKGLGAGQQKLSFLQEVHTDYIFALVGEELGFVGTALVVLAFAALLLQGMRAVDRARDAFSFLVALGLTLIVALQSALNIAVATASVPPKGIALPFISFGGSSLLMAACAAGLLARIAAEGRDPGPILEVEEEEPDPLASGARAANAWEAA